MLRRALPPALAAAVAALALGWSALAQPKPAARAVEDLADEAAFLNAVRDPSALTFVKFHAPWCGHCRRLEAAFETTGEAFRGDGAVRCAAVDCTATGDLCARAGVRGYPTLRAFRAGAVVAQHDGGRSADELAAFVRAHRRTGGEGGGGGASGA